MNFKNKRQVLILDLQYLENELPQYQLHALSTQEGRPREPSVKTLPSPFSHKNAKINYKKSKPSSVV